jgi:hypothetical protein
MGLLLGLVSGVAVPSDPVVAEVLEEGGKLLEIDRFDEKASGAVFVGGEHIGFGSGGCEDDRGDKFKSGF